MLSTVLRYLPIGTVFPASLTALAIGSAMSKARPVWVSASKMIR
ncbi:hypothetical protein QU487_07720 [Crenobacter sp. SG2305]|nr:hypothetical protein [Crenobacter sp. SG2305]MDN0082636.1 hypothetical protein [Crenobacter sp. SG2305]